MLCQRRDGGLCRTVVSVRRTCPLTPRSCSWFVFHGPSPSSGVRAYGTMATDVPAEARLSLVPDDVEGRPADMEVAYRGSTHFRFWIFTPEQLRTSCHRAQGTHRSAQSALTACHEPK